MHTHRYCSPSVKRIIKVYSRSHSATRTDKNAAANEDEYPAICDYEEKKKFTTV
jgi:hypothetical protein